MAISHMALVRRHGFNRQRFNFGVGLLSVLVAPAAWAWPDLLVVKTGPTQAAPGELISYTLTYSNAGPVKGTSVVLKDYLPANVTVATNTLGSGSLNSGIVTWTLGTVNSHAGGSRTFQVLVASNAPSGLFITNRAQVTLQEAEETGKTANNTSILVTKIFSNNRPPVALNDSHVVNEDTVLTIAAPGILANDSDPDGNPLTAILASTPTHGALNLNSNGGFTYTPAGNYTGSDSFTYRANDGLTNSGVATVNITVNPLNDAPGAVNDSYTTPEDTALNIAAPGVLANDSDADGDGLTAILVTSPTHGTLTLNANGGFSYLPASNYVGPDGFTYKANDGKTNSTIATVNLTVTPVNDPPVAANENYSTPEDTTLNISAPGVLGNDTDTDGDALKAILVTGTTHGTLTLNTNGSFSYKPASHYTGGDSFTYTANDAVSSSSTATVSINVTPVNDAPVAVNDNYTTLEDTALTIAAPGVLGNDTDVDGDSLTAMLVSNPTHGTVTLNFNGSFTYTPTNNFTGPDSFTYKANDGLTNSGVATVSINVTPANDAPLAVDEGYATPEDTTLNISAPGVLGNDTDADGDALKAILVTGTAHGTLTLNTNGSFTYTPTANYTGQDRFTYKASDGLTNSSVATVSINVMPVNDVPVAVNDNYTTPEDTALSIGAPGVLANDSDPDGDSLTTMLVTSPAHGTLSLNLNGSFTYTPANNYTGPDSFTYKASDGLTNSGVATVSINVTSVNDAPVAADDGYTTLEDTPFNISAPGVLGNDSDVDGDTLTAVLVSSPAHGTVTLNLNGSFTYTPANNYTGPDSFTYKASDGLTNSGVVTVSINVTPINDPPVAVNDNYTTTEDITLDVATPGILGNDSDVDGDTLTAVLVSNPAHGTVMLNLNGSFSYTPVNNYTGPDSFTYKASDGLTNSAVATVSINVTPINDVPVVVNDSYTTPEDTALNISTPGVLGNDSDADGDLLRAVLVTGSAHGTLTLNTNGSFTYTPANNYTGPDSFTYKASDGLTNSGVASVLINVTPVNDAPLAVNDDYTTPEETTLTLTAPGVLTNDSDPDGDALSAALVSLPVHGELTLNANGSFTYTPTNDYHGLDNFSYRANDGLMDSAVATVTIHVTPVNHPPDPRNWNGKQFTVYEDQTLSISALEFLASLRDRDGDLLSVMPVAVTTSGLLNFLSDGAFTYRPRTNFNGADNFQFRVSDGVTNTAVLTASITVLPVNDEPSFTKGANQLIQQNSGPQTIPFWAYNISPGPTDEAGQTVIFQISHDNSALFSEPPAVNSSGTLTYTPAPNRYGTATVTVVAQDDGGTANGGVDRSAPQTFSITVNGPPTVAITSPTNGAVFFAPASFTLLADARDPDGTIAKVEFLTGTNTLGEVSTGEPYFIVLTNLAVGTYTYQATATDNLGATGTSSLVTVSVIPRPPLTTLSALHYNPQTDFFETRVRITNPTYSTLDAVRVWVRNLTNTPAITVHNRSGITNGVPYVQTHAVVPPGSYVDMTIEFYSPLRIAPNPILEAELIKPADSLTAPTGVAQPINRAWMLGNKTFVIELSTRSNRVYSVQYSPDLTNWKAAFPAVTGNGNWVQWIDNGEPKTEGAPGSQIARFYRVLLLP